MFVQARLLNRCTLPCEGWQVAQYASVIWEQLLDLVKGQFSRICKSHPVHYQLVHLQKFSSLEIISYYL